MEITVKQLSESCCDEYVYVDVWSEIAYQHGHITNALWWDGSDESIDFLPKDKKLIVF